MTRFLLHVHIQIRFRRVGYAKTAKPTFLYHLFMFPSPILFSPQNFILAMIVWKNKN